MKTFTLVLAAMMAIAVSACTVPPTHAVGAPVQGDNNHSDI